jgi:hypothetical protein
MNDIASDRRTRRRRDQERIPFGSLAALFTGCIVTLIGVFSGIEPFDVLVRSVVSAVAMGLLVSIGVAIIRVADLKRE